MALTFANPINGTGGLIFAAQDYVSAPISFDGVGVRSVLRLRGRFPGVGIDPGGFLENDTDPDGDPLSYAIVDNVNNGVLTAYHGSAFTYVPNPGFVGFDSFTYQVYAGGTAGNTGTVNLSVEGAFNGVGVPSRLRLKSSFATLAAGAALQAVRSVLRLRALPASLSIDSAFNGVGVQSVLRLRSNPASLVTGSPFSGLAVRSILRLRSSPASIALGTGFEGQGVQSVLRLRATPAEIILNVPFAGAAVRTLLRLRSYPGLGAPPAIQIFSVSIAAKNPAMTIKSRKCIIDTVNERSTSYLVVTFKNKDGVAISPASVSYRIDCLTTNTQVRGDTSIVASGTVEIVLSPTDNAMVLPGNIVERRRVTVTGIYNAGDEITEEYVYELKNLFGVI